MSRLVSRRTFVQSLAAGAALPLVSNRARAVDAASKLNLVSIGVGGKGWSDLTSIAASPYVNVLALCDTDEGPKFMGRAAEKYPQAKRFTDWRKVLELPGIDAVSVSTPDHMHAPVALAALALKKPVFCQKPLTHTVKEARLMNDAAKRAGVVTQMGNQIQSHEAYRTAVKLVHDGVIGKVKEVYSWQAGTPQWPRAIDRPPGADPVPPGLHWNDWLGVAPERPYKNGIYHSFNWRGWQDFSNGQLGDFGCHILDPVFKALELTAPTTIKADAPADNKESWTKWATVAYEFPGTKHTAASTIKVTWYDGEGVTPPHKLLGLDESFKLPGSGSLLIGEKGSLLVPHVAMPQLLPKEKFADFKLPELEKQDHYLAFVNAIRGEGQTGSHFGYASQLTEAVLLGSIGVRLPGETLQWDAANLKFTNSTTANQMVSKAYRKGWELPGLTS